MGGRAAASVHLVLRVDYRVIVRRMRGHRDAQARQVARDLVDVPGAQVTPIEGLGKAWSKVACFGRCTSPSSSMPRSSAPIGAQTAVCGRSTSFCVVPQFDPGTGDKVVDVFCATFVPLPR
jgi:hypothetical protein